MTFIPYTGDAMPVHAETITDVFYANGDFDRNIRAGNVNWCRDVDGPRVVAYEVIEEYTPPKEPREWWFSFGDADIDDDIVVLHATYAAADDGRRDGYGRILAGRSIIHVQEVIE